MEWLFLGVAISCLLWLGLFLLYGWVYKDRVQTWVDSRKRL